MAEPHSLIGQTISHYRIHEKLGGGGMGIVYRAEDIKLRRPVALKFLSEESVRDPQAIERFEREARAASALNHPNICTIYDIDDHENQPFIAMELMEGQTVKHRLTSGPMKVDEMLDLAIQIADALDAAHARGIIHRDIKPANLFVTHRAQVKILDFGLAKLAPKRLKAGKAVGVTDAPTITGEQDLTSPGTAIGTVAYMSPEQARGEEVDARTDLFSLGVVLYEMATGRQAFFGNTSAVIFDAILNRSPAAPNQVNPKLPPDLSRVIIKCLEKDCKARYQDATSLLADLRRLKLGSDSGRAAASATPADRSLAVLYFQNLSGAKEEEYFRDGMTEDVITELSKVKDLEVFPRSAVLAFRDKPATAPQVGQELGAAYVLEGSVRRSGNRLRVTAQLVQARTGKAAWAERYDREMKDVFEVQDDIARSITQALRVTLSPQEEKSIARKPTENLQAYDYFLRGRNYVRRENLEFAMQMFEHAIRLDPDFALAHAGIANISGMQFELHGRDPVWIEKGQAAANRAFELDPQLPEALAARARICHVQQKYDEAVQLARMAIDRKPDCESAWDVLGRALFCSDRWQEAANLVERAFEAAGDDYNVHIPYFNAVAALGDHETASKLIERYVRILERQIEMVPEDARARILLANRYAQLGRSNDAPQQLEKAVAMRPNDPNTLFNAACTYGILLMKEEALRMLRRAIDTGFTDIDWISRDPDLACLHGDPEFESLVKLGKDAG